MVVGGVEFLLLLFSLYLITGLYISIFYFFCLFTFLCLYETCFVLKFEKEIKVAPHNIKWKTVKTWRVTDFLPLIWWPDTKDPKISSWSVSTFKSCGSAQQTAGRRCQPTLTFISQLRGFIAVDTLPPSSQQSLKIT